MTPPLREQRQNIPLLAMHFLQEGEHMAGRTGLTLSRGALKTMLAYEWPGNIRELKHVIITAAVMSEGRVIQAEQLGINGVKEAPEAAEVGALFFQEQDAAAEGDPAPQRKRQEHAAEPLPRDLNQRQVMACEYVQEHGSISSKDLLGLLDGEISKRTASYDIQDLVNRGLLVRIGRGPSTRYVRPASAENV
jgi:DNA-binding NtrC family response regulator